MKPLTLLAAFAALSPMLSAQTPLPGNRPGQTPASQQAGTVSPAPTPDVPLASNMFEWDKLAVIPTKLGVRRDVLEGRTTTLDKLHCHITTLNPGERSGEPRLHLQEEVIIVKEGTVEANFDGQVRTGGPGSVIFFAAHSTTFLRNAGNTPATYIVIYYYTPLTPKS